MTLAFIDLQSGPNLENGLEYYAAGLVLDDCRGKKTSKDFLVCYIDPWGECQTAWRAEAEIRVMEISDADVSRLADAHRRAAERGF